MDEVALERGFFLRASSVFPANHHSSIAPYPSTTAPNVVTNLTRQHIIISSAFKLGTSSLTRHLDGYRVRISYASSPKRFLPKVSSPKLLCSCYFTMHTAYLAHLIRGGGVEVQTQGFLTSALDGDKWSALGLSPLYPRYPFHRRLGGPHSRSELCEEEKTLLILSGIELRFLSRPARMYVYIYNGLGTMLQARKVAGSNPDEVIGFFN
jgi:hypothetical protein